MGRVPEVEGKEWHALRMLAVVAMTCIAGTSHAMGPLHKAAATGDIAAVKAWIAKKRDLDVTFDETPGGIEGSATRTRGLTALMLASQRGELEVVKLLVEAGADLYAESRQRDGSNPRNAFDYAVGAGRIATAQYLWASSDGVGYAGRLDKHIAEACQLGCDEKFGGDAASNLALFLISITRDDTVRGKGIGEAVCYGRRPLELLAFLEIHGVSFPRNTLHCIAYNPTIRTLRSTEERIAIASVLLDHGADPNDPPHSPLRGAAAGHDVEMVRFLLSRGADPNLRSADGLTPVAAAANSCTRGGSAEELEAKLKPQLDVIELLVRAGADTTLPSSAGERPRLQILMDCCRREARTASQRRICRAFGL
jgi:ankyrin repeat protein